MKYILGTIPVFAYIVVIFHSRINGQHNGSYSTLARTTTWCFAAASIYACVTLMQECHPHKQRFGRWKLFSIEYANKLSREGIFPHNFVQTTAMIVGQRYWSFDWIGMKNADTRIETFELWSIAIVSSFHLIRAAARCILIDRPRMLKEHNMAIL